MQAIYCTTGQFLSSDNIFINILYLNPMFYFILSYFLSYFISLYFPGHFWYKLLFPSSLNVLLEYFSFLSLLFPSLENEMTLKDKV